MKRKKLESLVSDWEQIKQQKAALAQDEKTIKQALEAHLKETGAESTSVNGKTVRLKAGKPSLKSTSTLPTTQAKQQLVLMLESSEGMGHLVKKSLNESIINDHKDDREIAELLDKAGLEITQNQTVELV